MASKQDIIKLYFEGMSKRKISKALNKSRNTVAKYIKEFEESKQDDTRNLPITEEIMRPPTYKKRKGKRKVLTEEIKRQIRLMVSFFILSVCSKNIIKGSL